MGYFLKIEKFKHLIQKEINKKKKSDKDNVNIYKNLIWLELIDIIKPIHMY